MDGNVSAVLVAVFASSIPATFAWLTAKKTHKEVQTNHGKRQGQRIEDLGVDMAWVRSQMVTKQELAEHAEHDVEVAKELADHVESNKQELLVAITGAKEQE